MTFDEFGDCRSDVGAAKSEGRIDSQKAPWLGTAAGDEALEFADVADNTRRALEVHLSLLSQVYASRGAVQQLNPEALLQLGEALARCRRGNRQLAGRQGQAALACDQAEKFQIGGIFH